MPFNPPKYPLWKQMLARTVRWLGETAAGLPEPNAAGVVFWPGCKLR